MRRRESEALGPGAPWAAARDKLALARAMRRAPTLSERRLWEALRRSALGFRFRRQHVIAGYVVDFYCPQCRLVIEVDGEVHDERAELDQRRDRALARLGVTVLRISTVRLNADQPTVIHDILRLCVELSQTPT